MIESFSIIIGIVALFSYINYQWIRLPGAIGLMMLSLIFAGILDLSKPYFPDFFNFFCQIVINADFEYFLFNVKKHYLKSIITVLEFFIHIWMFRYTQFYFICNWQFSIRFIIIFYTHHMHMRIVAVITSCCL